jgi:DNA-binding response OmpR family regulator
MPHRILCVSYDVHLLLSRRLLLQQQGFDVTTGLGFGDSLALCGHSGFALFILGHSIPYSDKTRLITRFRETCDAPVLALWRHNERVIDTVNFIAFSDDPAEFLKAVTRILAGEDRR